MIRDFNRRDGRYNQKKHNYKESNTELRSDTATVNYHKRPKKRTHKSPSVQTRSSFFSNVNASILSLPNSQEHTCPIGSLHEVEKNSRIKR